MVINLGLAKEHDWAGVGDDIGDVRAAVGGTLKVIVESAALDAVRARRGRPGRRRRRRRLPQDLHRLPPGRRRDARGGGALARVAASAGRPVGVKASGGIRDTATALAMLDAGATRIGCSASRAILDGLR